MLATFTNATTTDNNDDDDENDYDNYNDYDDYFNCFTAWMAGHKVLVMPIAGKIQNAGEGGMRLYNSVNVTSRPEHFIDNWNFVYDRFKEPWVQGEITARVKAANTALQTEDQLHQQPRVEVADA